MLRWLTVVHLMHHMCICTCQCQVLHVCTQIVELRCIVGQANRISPGSTGNNWSLLPLLS
jgi:hypothetical protein